MHDSLDGVPQALPVFVPAEEPVAGVRAALAPLGAATDDFFWGIWRMLRGIRLWPNDTGDFHFSSSKQKGRDKPKFVPVLLIILSQDLVPGFVPPYLVGWKRGTRSLSWLSVWPLVACHLTPGHSSANSLWHGTVLSVPLGRIIARWRSGRSGRRSPLWRLGNSARRNDHG